MSMAVENPSVSIILPIRNEEKFIEDTLSAVCRQTFPSDDYEIILADGLSDDNTLSVIEGIKNKFHSVSIRVISNPEKIVPAALNAAIREAKGQIIVRIDGHTHIEPDYVERCVECIQKYSVENVGGRMDAISDTFIGYAISLATSSPFGVGGARFHYSDQEEFVDTVYMGAWPKSVFKEIGGFDEELVRDQDDEFNYRLRSNGGKIILSPKIKSKYYPRTTLNKLFKQYYQYGYWKVRVFQKHPTQMQPRQFVPVIFVASIIFCIILSLFTSIGKYLLLLILGSYLGANLLASFWVASKNNWKFVSVLPVVFTTLHISYGLGFFVGLFRFIHRWGDKEGKVPFFDF